MTTTSDNIEHPFRLPHQLSLSAAPPQHGAACRRTVRGSSGLCPATRNHGIGFKMTGNLPSADSASMYRRRQTFQSAATRPRCASKSVLSNACMCVCVSSSEATAQYNGTKNLSITIKREMEGSPEGEEGAAVCPESLDGMWAMEHRGLGSGVELRCV